ncbi:uncharacterized protein TNCV_586861 [Trichonephila clavipes]|nr:uncharacterized protein TNCV_586861 [Trichonephila clavipes]
MFKIPPERSTYRKKKLPPKEAENFAQLKEECTYIIFNDEKKFCLDDYAGFDYYFHDLRKKVLSRRQYGVGSVMIWTCIGYHVPARHGGTLNSRRAESPLVRLVEGEERWKASDHPKSVLPLNWGGIEPNRTDTCMVLKATANDRRHLALCHDEFRGP